MILVYCHSPLRNKFGEDYYQGKDRDNAKSNKERNLLGIITFFVLSLFSVTFGFILCRDTLLLIVY